ncbi:MAG TPA: hypothetical protein VK034_21650 [Enhygromyxa sp.]|nr:hypothetical protein [Enhygromyxa sp.]
MELDIHRLSAAEAMATLGPVFCRVVRTAQSELSDIDEVKSIIDKVLERWPTAGGFVIVHHGAPVPSAPVRRASSRMFEAYGDRLVMCHVMLGLGFWASAARVATIAITGLMGNPAPIETSVEAGAQRLATELIGIDPAKLVALHDDLLARMTTSGASVA